MAAKYATGRSVTVALTETQHARVATVARRREISKAAVLREIIDHPSFVGMFSIPEPERGFEFPGGLQRLLPLYKNGALAGSAVWYRNGGFEWANGRELRPGAMLLDGGVMYKLKRDDEGWRGDAVL